MPDSLSHASSKPLTGYRLFEMRLKIDEDDLRCSSQNPWLSGNRSISKSLSKLVKSFKEITLNLSPRGTTATPRLKGRWSLKAVLPTIAPELDYGALAIGDGDAASNAWRELYHSDTSAERRAELRAALADYCHRDTLALVRLAAFLAETQPE